MRRGFRLLALVWPFVAVVIAQVVIASFSLYTLSAVRAYVGGESFWSKGQKDAIYQLSLYANTGDRKFFDHYRASIDVVLADRQARVALDSKFPVAREAEAGFLGGGNHPDDVPGMVWLFSNFRWFIYLDRAVSQWAAADDVIENLYTLSLEIRDGYTEHRASAAQIAEWQAEIHAINDMIAPLSKGFAQTLGEGSRVITLLLLAANILTAAALIALAVWRTRKLMAQRLSVEQALATEREKAAVTLASIGDAVFSTNAYGQLDYMNTAAERLTGWTQEAARGRQFSTIFQLMDTEAGEIDTAVIERVLAGLPADGGVGLRSLLRVNASALPVSLGGALLMVDGRASGAVIVLHDMSREQDFIAQLSWQASHDELTGFANRREFERRLESALADTGRDCGFSPSLMFVDLDQFKIVNDTSGHAAGDELLRRVSAALSGVMGPSDTVARLGGDEFGILLQSSTAEAAAETAEKLRKAVSDLQFIWSGRQFAISASIGLVHLAQAGIDLEEAMRAADVACYMAKEKGRNRVQIHHPSDTELLRRFGEMAWVQRLHEALEHNRFVLYAQEIAPLQQRLHQGAHVEILLRLRDEVGDIVPPGRFIPAAERYGLMPQIDRWVVRNTFTILAARSRVPGAAIHTCAINLSGPTFSDPHFISFLHEQFALHGIAPATICFEITETSAISDLPHAIQFITELKGIGCRFALDDFGSGMSSFSYLKHLPVDYLKIDGGFVKHMLHDPIDRAMVEMFERIGKLMGKTTIAEFVEDDATEQMLREIGVDYAQGFGIARPYHFDVRSSISAEKDYQRVVA